MIVLEIVELFSTCLDYDSIANQIEIEIIVQELEYLALVVTLVELYVLEIHLKLNKYREKYRYRRKELLNKKLENLVYEYSKSILAI